jgi:biopolymer transport protein ExbD
MRKRRRRFQAQSFDRIDVTPLLDLTFLLLIAFMITMPLMEYGTSIKAPKMNSGKLPDNNFISITITEKGTILFDKEAVSKEQLVEKLSELKVSGSKKELLLRADGSRTYRDVIELMALIRNSGFEDVVLVTQAEDKK